MSATRDPDKTRESHRGNTSVGAYSIGGEPRRKRAAWLIPLLVLIGLALLGWLLWALLHHSSSTPAAAAKPTPSATATSPAVTPSSSPASSASGSPATTTASASSSSTGGAGAAGSSAAMVGGAVAAHAATGTEAKAGHYGAVLFATDSAALTAESRKVIDAAAAAIKAQGSGTVTVTGYSDVVGGQPVNTTLTTKRATTVEAALKQAMGSTAGFTFTTASKGQKDPVATNSTAAGRQQNRRAEITLGA